MVIITIKKSLPNFDIDLTLRFGNEIAVLTGPNGSGKSTVLRTIAGLEPQNSGSITVLGKIYFDNNTTLPSEERLVGYVSQSESLFPWLTIEDNICFGLKKGEREKSKKLLNRLYDELELDSLLTRYPSSLSGGEAERVALARALANRPEFLLLDEPFSAIDKELKPKFRNFLKKLQKEWGLPILIVTHDPAEAHTLGDKIFRIEDGSLAETFERGRLNKIPSVSY
ncbi:MAG: ATP-binding cassette domain-containing protein [Deltaproteobacteria bacterium]|nr:ATP-binding cassette domain-containing protein [Deltaproteobacteria bacterium]